MKNSGLAAGSDDPIASITGTVEIFWVDRGVTRSHYRLTIAYVPSPHLSLRLGLVPLPLAF